jgi:hypothetical protein
MTSSFSGSIPRDFGLPLTRVTADVGRGLPEISLAPLSTLPVFRSPYAVESFETARPEPSALPWPSPVVERLGSPLPLTGGPHGTTGFPS